MRINSVSNANARSNTNVVRVAKNSTMPSFYGYQENYARVLEDVLQKGRNGLPMSKDIMLTNISNLIKAAKEFPQSNKNPFYDAVIANMEYDRNPWQLLADLKYESGGPTARRLVSAAIENYIYPLVKNSSSETCVGLRYMGDHLFSGHKHKFELLFMNPETEKGLSIWLSRDNLFNYGELGHQGYRTYYGDYSWCEWGHHCTDSYPIGTM